MVRSAEISVGVVGGQLTVDQHFRFRAGRKRAFGWRFGHRATVEGLVGHIWKQSPTEGSLRHCFTSIYRRISLTDSNCEKCGSEAMSAAGDSWGVSLPWRSTSMSARSALMRAPQVEIQARSLVSRTV